MRKLASIQRVLNLIPIPDADAIELAQINGWQCVVRKGSFPIGSLGVYLEIDAVPPERPMFDFLLKGQARTKSFRIRTMRLRGALSQGLLMPLSDFPEVAGLEDGTDCTELLGVTKYEPPPPDGMGDYGGPFHPLIHKTDEIRLQSMPSLLEELRGLAYCIVEKCDGTSSTLTADEDGTFHVYGRNHEIAESDNIFWRATRRCNVKEALQKNPDLALQCEVVGPGVQKNHMGLQYVELRAFNLFRKSTGEHLGQSALDKFCEEWNIPQARVLEWGEDFQHTQESLLKLADWVYEGTKNPREGIVLRPQKPVHSHLLGGRLSFKVINNTYLLKGGV